VVDGEMFKIGIPAIVVEAICLGGIVASSDTSPPRVEPHLEGWNNSWNRVPLDDDSNWLST